MYGFDPPNEASSKRAVDGKIHFIKPRKVYNNFTSQNSEGKANRGDSERKFGQTSDPVSERDANQKANTQVQRPNTSGKPLKAKQTEQSVDSIERGNGSSRSSRMIKQAQAATN